MTEANKMIVRRLYDAVNTANFAVIDELVTSDFVSHSPEFAPGMGGTQNGPDSLKRDVTMLRTLAPDIHIDIEELVAESDRVGVRGITRGTHTGEVPGIAPTGTNLLFTWVAIYRITNGKIVERWLNADDLSSMQQLGLLPPLEQRLS